jgi:hypothetical protein
MALCGMTKIEVVERALLHIVGLASASPLLLVHAFGDTGHCYDRVSALDEGTFDAAGFDYEIELWSPGKEGCCLTKITEKSQS